MGRTLSKKGRGGVWLLIGMLITGSTLFVTAGTSSAAQKYVVQECAVPGTVPKEPGATGSGFAAGLGSGIALAPDGTVWATRTDAALTAMSPTGKIRRIPLPEAVTATSVTVDRAGDVWFTYEGGNYPLGGIGEITSSGQVLQLLDAAAAQSYHVYNVAPSAITEGPDGAMYFTEAYLKEVGRISGGQVTAVPTETQFSSVSVGPTGQMWFGEYASESTVGARWDLGSGSFAYFPGGEPPAAVEVTGVGAGGDGGAWFAGWAIYGGTAPPGPKRILVTRVDPSGAPSTFIARGSGGYRPTGVWAGKDGAAWIASSSDHGPGVIWHITPSLKQTRITATTMPTHQVNLGAITEGREGAVWYLDLSRGAIGRVSKPGLPRLKCKPAELPPWAKKDYPNAK